MKHLIFKSVLPISLTIGAVVFGIFFLRSMGMSQKGTPRRDMRVGATEPMKLTSSAFENNQMIPKKYSCDGNPPAGGINPPLRISGVPDETQSLALIVHDPDAMAQGGWTHWVLFNMDPGMTDIAENSIPQDAIQGTTSFGSSVYGGPCPPSGGAHHYEFKLYALDSHLALSESAKKVDVEHAMEGHVIDLATLIGLYSRAK